MFTLVSKVMFYAFFILGVAKFIFDCIPIKRKDYVKK